MEDKFNNRDFEQFVKQNADQYRMFPSEKVWNNIHHALHTRRRWYLVGITVLLLTSGIVTWVMLIPSVKNNGSITVITNPDTQSKKIEPKNISAPVLIAAAKPTGNMNRFASDNLQKNLFISAPADMLSENSGNEKNEITTDLQKIAEPVMTASPVHVELQTKTSVIPNKKFIPFTQNIIINNSESAKNSLPLYSENNIADKKVNDITPAAEKKDLFPLTIESVVNSYKHQRSGKKLSWEFFVTPTVSYRRLSENKEFINSTLSNNNVSNYYTSVSDINSLVTHKPDIGIQAGFTAGYPLSKSLTVIGGLQFNVSKYDIGVTYSSGEVATIALNTNSGANTVSTISNYRNNSSGLKADWLRNFYFSASLPIGAELKLSGNNKTQIGVSGTIQPTYILSDRAYLLTTDYKNYAEVPSLTRKWNMSASFGIYAGITTGNINWRIGPQVRYQLKSSYVAKYPFKEHLFDFGLKLGIMLKK